LRRRWPFPPDMCRLPVNWNDREARGGIRRLAKQESNPRAAGQPGETEKGLQVSFSEKAPDPPRLFPGTLAILQIAKRNRIRIEDQSAAGSGPEVRKPPGNEDLPYCPGRAADRVGGLVIEREA
jgi:hypothetical protein